VKQPQHFYSHNLPCYFTTVMFHGQSYDVTAGVRRSV
jgi:hypothetical protein